MSDYNITLAKVKAHLRILHNREDDYIELLIKTAIAAVENFIDRPFNAVNILGMPILLDLTGSVPAPLEAAVYMVVQDLYANRSSQTDSALFSNPTFERLTMPYRRMGV